MNLDSDKKGSEVEFSSEEDKPKAFESEEEVKLDHLLNKNKDIPMSPLKQRAGSNPPP